MTRLEKLIEAEIADRLRDIEAETRERVEAAWRHFRNTGECSFLACRYCPFNNEKCDYISEGGELCQKYLEELDEEVNNES